ncbi:hypothetical protein [Aliarcobacter cryaerophilus]|uniref:hypothetical protein n=1 Tax=Aliarcobacter cryaerophilus TaxID=28198 RepID=UPI000EB13B35|nr:hypothetical protein [Aliarcobacter cryaerophilus]AYJ77749.1 hypothetical protein ACRYD_0597 [Aliarcobacter cryaerophilus D2610]
MKKEISNFLNISERNYYIWKKQQHPMLISLLHILFSNESELNNYIQFNYLAIDSNSITQILDKKKYKQLILKILNLSERNYYIWKNDENKSKAITIVQQAIRNEFEAQYFIDNNQLYTQNDFKDFEIILDYLVTPINVVYEFSEKTNYIIFNKLDAKRIQIDDNLTKEEYIMLMNRYFILQSFYDVTEIQKCGKIENDNVRFLLAQTTISKFGKDDTLMDLLTTRELNQIQNNIFQNNFKLQNNDIFTLINLIKNQQLYSLLHYIIGIEDSTKQIKYFDAFLFFLVTINNLDPIDFYKNHKKHLYSRSKKYNLNLKENRIKFFIDIYNSLL